jgi:pimeloyl-ACP methyl ester carboxylesterase
VTAFRSRFLLAAAIAAALVATAAIAPAGAAGQHTKTDVAVTGAQDTPIWISIYRPAGASPSNPVPVILHSHGWGGSRTKSEGAFATELDRGYGVVSIDQRGFGDSGGLANVEDPDLEGVDVIRVIDHVARLPWVAKDRDSRGRIIAGDPILFAMGGSYGGGYQFIGALTEVRNTGRTRFNALAPEITWFNLSRSLAPQKVTRTAWAALLYAVGAKDIVEYVHPAFAWGAGTGQWPDGTNPAVHNLEKEFFGHGPSGFVRQGIRLDIPTLISQGASDNLFNLNEGIDNFQRTLTPRARSKSLFLSFNGGHALPNAAPVGYATGGDACSGPGGFSALRLRFFDAVLAGRNPADLLPASYNLTTADAKQCISTNSINDYRRFKPGVDVEVTTGTATTTGAGAPQHLEVAQGPMNITGIPKLRSTVTSLGVDQRVFFAISVGTSPADARVVQNNMMPLREFTPVVQTDRVIPLPGIAVDVKKGEKVFLTVSPVSDMSFGHGSVRTPGVVALENLRLDLPIARPLARR